MPMSKSSQPEFTVTKTGAGQASGATRVVNLALQGGGAHGAFTWGVLDRLMDDERIEIEGISATSAGAMNSVVMAYGLVTGGRQGAKRALETFWKRVSDAAAIGPLQPSFLDRWVDNFALDYSPSFVMMDLMSRLLSPYEFNPANVNPLKKILESCVDFKVLREDPGKVKLFISATNVRTGKIKLFERSELCAQAVLASACLPYMFQAVELNGEHYWDGGYMGNPALFPLIYNCKSSDIVIVHINPLERPDVPVTARDIMNRINEIGFNSSLMREMRAIAFVTKLIEDGKLDRNEMRQMLIHSISADDVMIKLGVNSKLNADWGFLQHLRDIGRDYAGRWLDENYEALGLRSSVNIRAQYL